MNQKPYLFYITLWCLDPPTYILAYGEDIVEARQKAAEKLVYNSGEQVKPNDLILATVF